VDFHFRDPIAKRRHNRNFDALRRVHKMKYWDALVAALCGRCILCHRCYRKCNEQRCELMYSPLRW